MELVEKNPSESNEDEGDVTIPTDKAPVERVFTGKLVSEVDDHGWTGSSMRTVSLLKWMAVTDI